MLLILTEIGQKLENTPPLTVRISKCRRGIFGILFRIDCITGRMRPKNQKMVLWGANIYFSQLTIKGKIDEREST